MVWVHWLTFDPLKNEYYRFFFPRENCFLILSSLSSFFLSVSSILIFWLNLLKLRLFFISYFCLPSLFSYFIISCPFLYLLLLFLSLSHFFFSDLYHCFLERQNWIFRFSFLLKKRKWLAYFRPKNHKISIPKKRWYVAELKISVSSIVIFLCAVFLEENNFPYLMLWPENCPPPLILKSLTSAGFDIHAFCLFLYYFV